MCLFDGCALLQSHGDASGGEPATKMSIDLHLRYMRGQRTHTGGVHPGDKAENKPNDELLLKSSISKSEQTGNKERSGDFKSWADAIIVAWDPYMELSATAALTPADLRPITRVMYASALLPGGECASS